MKLRRILDAARIFLVIAIVIALAPVNVRAAPISETLYFKGTPTQKQLKEWSAFSSPKRIRIELDISTNAEIERLAQLSGFDRVQIVAQDYPTQRQFAAYSKVSAAGFDFVVNSPVYPTSRSIDVLNRLNFNHTVLIEPDYPSVDSATVLQQITVPFSITFSTNRLPKYEERYGLAALPTSAVLLFTSDFWPGYFGMDVLNIIPQDVKLRIIGTLPDPKVMPYVLGIQRLKEVNVQTDDVPANASLWSRFGDLPVKWTLEKSIPSADALDAFVNSASNFSLRRVIINRDDTLTTAERLRLEQIPVSVEWIHSIY